jgi:hypothetical protein
MKHRLALLSITITTQKRRETHRRKASNGLEDGCLLQVSPPTNILDKILHDLDHYAATTAMKGRYGVGIMAILGSITNLPFVSVANTGGRQCCSYAGCRVSYMVSMVLLSLCPRYLMQLLRSIWTMDFLRADEGLQGDIYNPPRDTRHKHRGP